jgi:hypothetical protein
MVWFIDRDFLTGLDLRAYDAAAIAERLGLPVGLVRASIDPTRKYWVQSCPEYGWLAGASGTDPALLFVGIPRLSGLVQQPLNAVVCNHSTGSIATHAIAVNGELTWDTVIDAAEAAIGFVHVGKAPMLAFTHPELWHYAIVPFPSHLHDDVTGADADDLADARSWIEKGNYVLHCGNDYYMGPEGEVESS